MKIVTGILVAFLLTVGIALAQDAAMASKTEMHVGAGNVEQQLTELESRWTAAALKGDGDAMESLLSEDFINLNSDGTVHDRADSLDRLKKAKWQVNEISELKVTEFGDSAIVTGTWTGKGTSAEGKPIDSKERWVDTWVKKDGKWQCVASASAPMDSVESDMEKTREKLNTK